jgi:hypothetical protein
MQDGGGMTLIRDIATIIQSMTDALRRTEPDEPPRSPDSGWWVLVCGAHLDAEDFDQREAAREDLRLTLSAHGISLREHIWVWDETDRAQVVVGQHASIRKAKRHADDLGRFGLEVRIISRCPDS